MREWLHGWSVNLAVWNALIIRETRTRFGKRQLGYLWALIEPMIWVLSFQVIFNVMGRQPPYDMPVSAFILTGILPFSLLRNMTNRIISAVQSNRSMLFYPQVHILDLCIARMLLEGLTALGVLAALWGAYALAGDVMYIEDPLAVLVGLLQITLLGMGLGMLGLTLAQFTQTAGIVVSVLFRPLFFISGIFYPIEKLPYSVQEILLYNPLLHVIQAIRDGWSPTYESDVVDEAYVWGWCIITLTVGFHYVRTLVRQRVEFS